MQADRVWTASREAPATDATAIAGQIAAVVREVSQTDQDGGAPPPRAHVMNLVVRAPDAQSVDRAAEIVGQLANTYPSRIFVIVAQPEAGEASLDASVTAFRLLLPSAQEMVCLEQVRLRAQGATARHLASIVVPLFIPDLPVFLWWIGEPPEEEESLLGVTQRLIVDSTGFQQPLPQLAKLYRILSGQMSAQGGAALSDFTWARLTPWRELVAQFFDGPEVLPYLFHLNRVHIEYATDPGGVAHAAPSLLLLGWLAAKLHWRPGELETRAHGRDYRLAFSADQGPVHAEVVPRARAGETGLTGELLSVELVATTEAGEATFAVTRTQDNEHAMTRTKLHGLREVTRTLPLERLSLVYLLHKELSILGNDHAFEESLAVTAHILS